MPQLDLAIYSLHIIYFVILYIIMYVMLRGSFILNISSMFKYRNKLFNYFSGKKNYFLEQFVLFITFLDIKTKMIISLYFIFFLNYFIFINFIFFYWIIFFNKVFFFKEKVFLIDLNKLNIILNNNYLI